MNRQKPDMALEIQDLSVEYRTSDGVVKALNSLDLSIKRGTALGLVGETGAGKTTAGFSCVFNKPRRSGPFMAAGGYGWS